MPFERGRFKKRKRTSIPRDLDRNASMRKNILSSFFYFLLLFFLLLFLYIYILVYIISIDILKWTTLIFLDSLNKFRDVQPLDLWVELIKTLYQIEMRDRSMALAVFLRHSYCLCLDIFTTIHGRP